MYPLATALTPTQLNFLSNLAVRNINKSTLVSIAIARVIYTFATVPTSPVISVDSYYNQQTMGLIDNVLDYINNIIPIDHRLIRDIAKCFFRFAYDTVHGGVSYLEGSIVTTGVNNFFRIDKHFAPIVIDTISVNSGMIEGLVAEFASILMTFRGISEQGVNNVA